MGTSDLVRVSVDEGAVSHDVLTLDDEPIHTVRRREDEAGDRVLGTAELEAVGNDGIKKSYSLRSRET